MLIDGQWTEREERMGNYHSTMSGFGFSYEIPDEDEEDDTALFKAGEQLGIHLEYCGDMVVGPMRCFITLADTFNANGKIKIRPILQEEIELLTKFASDNNLVPDEEPQWMTESYFG